MLIDMVIGMVIIVMVIIVIIKVIAIVMVMVSVTLMVLVMVVLMIMVMILVIMGHWSWSQFHKPCSIFYPDFWVTLFKPRMVFTLIGRHGVVVAPLVAKVL